MPSELNSAGNTHDSPLHILSRPFLLLLRGCDFKAIASQRILPQIGILLKIRLVGARTHLRKEKRRSTPGLYLIGTDFGSSRLSSSGG